MSVQQIVDIDQVLWLRYAQI